MAFRLRRYLRILFAVLGLLAALTVAAFQWPSSPAADARLLVANVPGLSWKAWVGQRILGVRLGGLNLVVPAALVGFVNVVLGLLALVWIGVEVSSSAWWRRLFAPDVVKKPKELEYHSPVFESPVARVATAKSATTTMVATPAMVQAASAAHPAGGGAASPEREGEELERAVTRLEMGDPAGAIRILEDLVGRAGSKDLIRYHLAIAYATNRQPDQLRSIMNHLPANDLPPQRRYRLAVMLDQARLYDIALPLYDGLMGQSDTYPDLVDRAARVREIVFEGGAEAFDRQLVSMLDARYTHAKVLASGGMGIVFSAWDAEPGRKIAIKMLSPMMRNDAESVKRFMREGLTLKELSHPNLVRTFQVHPSPIPHYSMELLAGNTLSELVQEVGPLPLDQLRGLSLQMLAGLGYCHDRKVIHRDIKSSNVLVPDAAPLKIIDFGLVRLGLATGITLAGTVMGTPAYMPPEQLHGLEVDHTADLYSFGVVLYEMATGRLPFAPGDDMARKIVLGKYDPPRALRPDLPPAFDVIVSRAMHISAEKRPRSAGEIAEVLAQVL